MTIHVEIQFSKDCYATAGDSETYIDACQYDYSLSTYTVRFRPGIAIVNATATFPSPEAKDVTVTYETDELAIAYTAAGDRWEGTKFVVRLTRELAVSYSIGTGIALPWILAFDVRE